MLHKNTLIQINLCNNESYIKNETKETENNWKWRYDRVYFHPPSPILLNRLTFDSPLVCLYTISCNKEFSKFPKKKMCQIG